jgi:hypothetical protein
MAIDTLAKRNSVLSVNSYILPIPDGTIAQDDRQTVLRVVGSILAGAAVETARRLGQYINIKIGIGI